MISLPWSRLSRMQIYYDSLATMLHSGLPIEKALSVIADETNNRQIRELAGFTISGIRNGLALSDIMLQRPGDFKRLDTAMVKAGEASGRLDLIFSTLARIYKDHLDNIMQLLSATAYPALLLHAGFIIPAFPSLVLEGFGAFAGSALLSIAILWTALGLLLFLHISAWHTFCPVLYGEFLSKISFGLLDKIILSRFLCSFSALFSSGVRVNQALGMAMEATGAEYMSARLRPALTALQQGASLTEAFRRCQGSIPRYIIEIVSTGEEAGSLDVIMDKAASKYRDESQIAVKTIARILPVLIFIIVGIYIGFVILSFWGDYYGNLLQIG